MHVYTENVGGKRSPIVQFPTVSIVQFRGKNRSLATSIPSFPALSCIPVISLMHNSVMYWAWPGADKSGCCRMIWVTVPHSPAAACLSTTQHPTDDQIPLCTQDRASAGGKRRHPELHYITKSPVSCKCFYQYFCIYD